MLAPRLILVGQDGCAPCVRVRRLLTELHESGFSFELREVAFDSPEGLELALRHNILYPPAVVLEGRLVAKGKVFAEDIRQALTVVGPSLAR